DLPQHAAREDADHDMRSLRLVARSRHHTWLDGVETVDAIFAGSRAAKAGELRVRARSLTSRMSVAALRVCLPNFNHGVVDRHPVAVQHPSLATHFLPLPSRLPPLLPH